MKSRKTFVFSIRLSSKDVNDWRKAAHREQVSQAHFIRDALRRRTSEVLPPKSSNRNEEMMVSEAIQGRWGGRK